MINKHLLDIKSPLNCICLTKKCSLGLLIHKRDKRNIGQWLTHTDKLCAILVHQANQQSFEKRTLHI